MTKKIFAQPEMMVVNVNNKDIITDSLGVNIGEEYLGTNNYAPGVRGFDDIDAGY